jgi:hypothetical protein
VLQYERTSDPWVSIGPDGTAYAVSLPFDADFIRNGLGAAVSHDGGRTWVHQRDIDPLVASADTFNPADDKESVTADPSAPAGPTQSGTSSTTSSRLARPPRGERQ